MGLIKRSQILVALMSLSLVACGGGDNGGNGGEDTSVVVDEGGNGGEDTAVVVDEGGNGGEDTAVVVDEGGSATGWSEIEAIFSSCAGCHTGGSCTGGNCFLNDYQGAVAAPSGPNCTGHATSIECGLARAKDGTMPLGGCAQVPCIPDAETVDAWIADGMPE